MKIRNQQGRSRVPFAKTYETCSARDGECIHWFSGRAHCAMLPLNAR